ncbi:MAG: flagellar protein FlaG [Gammaproteobacteria bacterium]|nr:flagellar protein FlaG [Gammaproteobacteria bacterium]
MNDINAIENLKTRVAELNATKVNAAKSAANARASDGNNLPSQTSTVEPKQSQQKPAKEITRTQSVDVAVAKLNDYAQSLQRDLRFSVDRELGRAVVSVIDRTTQEIIRQIPNETALQLARNLKDIMNVNDVNAHTQAQSQVEVARDAISSLGLINTRI